MFNLVQGWGMMSGSRFFEGSSDAVRSFDGYYGHMGPWMMGFGGFESSPVLQVLTVAYSFFLQALIILALISFIRFFWKKGDHK